MIVILLVLLAVISASGQQDIRITKGFGKRSYDSVRVSVISSVNSTHPSSSVFSYQQPFQYRWKQFYLSTGTVSLKEGVNEIQIDGKSISVNLPAPGAPVRGLLVADPCVSGSCEIGNMFQLNVTLPKLFDAILTKSDVDYYGILGDNFYDKDGDITYSFFDSLSNEAKSKYFFSVNGNHDMWIGGNPRDLEDNDSLGYGYIQYYGQDVISTLDNDQLYDFSVNPDATDDLSPASNYFHYSVLGNTGFISFSGCHSFDDTEDYFNEACDFMSTQTLDHVLLFGHWNIAGDGDINTNTPHVYKELMKNGHCESIKSKLKYFVGHWHCNQVVDDHVGYMIGACGKSSEEVSCSMNPGEWGITISESASGSHNVYYFPIQNTGGLDNYQALLDCINTKEGISNCYEFATKW